MTPVQITGSGSKCVTREQSVSLKDIPSLANVYLVSMETEKAVKVAFQKPKPSLYKCHRAGELQISTNARL